MTLTPQLIASWVATGGLAVTMAVLALRTGHLRHRESPRRCPTCGTIIASGACGRCGTS